MKTCMVRKGRGFPQIPTLQFVIFYNGSQEQPDRKILNSDAYCVKEEHPDFAGDAEH